MITKLSCCLQEHITLLSGFNYFCLEICQSYCISFKQNVSCSSGFFQGCSHYPRCPTFAVMLRINPAVISLNFLGVFIWVCSDFIKLGSFVLSLFLYFYFKCLIFSLCSECLRCDFLSFFVATSLYIYFWNVSLVLTQFLKLLAFNFRHCVFNALIKLFIYFMH